jgi:hypothetical protein
LHTAFPFTLYLEVWSAVAGRTEISATLWPPRDAYGQAALPSLKPDWQEEGEEQYVQEQGGEKDL